MWWKRNKGFLYESGAEWEWGEHQHGAASMESDDFGEVIHESRRNTPREISEKNGVVKKRKLGGPENK